MDSTTTSTLSSSENKKPQNTWLSGARHVIVSRKAIAVFVAASALVAGLFAAERIRLHHNATRLKEGKRRIEGTNLRLQAEKDDYKTLFQQMGEHLEHWKAAKEEGSQKKHALSFHEMGEALMLGLDDVRRVLEEKEFQLWEKEGLLEYQEERLLDSEDAEVQMATYVNLLAKAMLDNNLTLPEGLKDQPYFGGGARRTGSFFKDDDDDDGAGGARRARLGSGRFSGSGESWKAESAKCSGGFSCGLLALVFFVVRLLRFGSSAGCGRGASSPNTRSSAFSRAISCGVSSILEREEGRSARRKEGGGSCCSACASFTGRKPLRASDGLR